MDADGGQARDGVGHRAERVARHAAAAHVPGRRPLFGRRQGEAARGAAGAAGVPAGQVQRAVPRPRRRRPLALRLAPPAALHGGCLRRARRHLLPLHPHPKGGDRAADPDDAAKGVHRRHRRRRQRRRHDPGGARRHRHPGARGAAGGARRRLFAAAVLAPWEAGSVARPQLLHALGDALAVCDPPRADHLRHPGGLFIALLLCARRAVQRRPRRRLRHHLHVRAPLLARARRGRLRAKRA